LEENATTLRDFGRMRTYFRGRKAPALQRGNGSVCV